MMEHHSQLANEIKQAYMNTMKWYYHHHFDRFKRALERFKLENRVDMLGDDSKKGLFSNAARTSLTSNDSFHLGDRIDILKEQSSLVSIPTKEVDQQVRPAREGL